MKYGWGARIRTWECWDQNPVPYRLATPQWIDPAQFAARLLALCSRLRQLSGEQRRPILAAGDEGRNRRWNFSQQLLRLSLSRQRSK